MEDYSDKATANPPHGEKGDFRKITVTLPPGAYNRLIQESVRGHGRQKGHTEVYRGQEYSIDLLPKVKVETVVPADRAEEVIQTITRAAHTGNIGDGKVFVFDVADAIRIRNGEQGAGAL